MIGILASPFVAVLLALGAGALLYGWGRSQAPVLPASGDKAMPYVGGEPSKAAVFRPGYAFYAVALFFTLLHVAALVLATVPAKAAPWAALGYLVFIAAAVLALRWER